MKNYVITFLFSIVVFSNTQLDFITGKLIGEGARLNDDALTQLTCTVKNRIDAGWSKGSVMNHYYAPYVKPTKSEKEKVKNIFENEYDCGKVYFAYSNSDRGHLGLRVEPLVKVCEGKKCINFYERYFRRR